MKLASFPILSSTIATAMVLVPIACGSQPGDPTASDTQALDPSHFCDPPILPPAPTLTATATCSGSTPMINITGEGFVHKSCIGWVGGDNVTVAYAELNASGQTSAAFSNSYNAQSTEAPAQVGDIPIFSLGIDPVEFPAATVSITASDVTTGVQANKGQPVIVTVPACLQFPIR